MGDEVTLRRFKSALSVLMFLLLAPVGASAAEPPARVLSKLLLQLISAPDSPVLHYEIGMAYFKQGARPQAEKEFQIALGLLKRGRTRGITEAEISKARLRAIRAQRPLAPFIKDLQDLRRMMPADEEAAMWMVEVHLGKGDVAAARAILTGFPQLRQNAEILSQWLQTGAAKGTTTYAVLEENFNDLATLLEIGSDAHKPQAAKQILEVAGQLPRATMTAARIKTVETAFALLKAKPEGPEEEVALYRQYLSLLDEWRARDKIKPLIIQMQMQFPQARGDAKLVYTLARNYAGEGKDDQAIAVIQDAFRLGLDDGGARMLLADLLQKKGRLHDAGMAYAMALEGLLSDADRRVVIVHLEEWLARLDPAKPPAAPDTLFEKLAQQLQASATAQILWATRLEGRGRYDSALERYQAAWRLDHRSSMARQGLARAAIRLGRTEDLVRVLPTLDRAEIRRLWETSPHLLLGRRLLTLGDTADVRQMTQRIGAAASASADELTLAAELAIAEGRLQDATALYLRLKQQRPLKGEEARTLSVARDQLLRQRAESYFASGQYRAAVDAYDSLSDSAAAPHVLRRAACLAKLDRLQDALLLLERARMDGALQIQRVALMANLYEQLSRPDRAEEVYRELVRSDSPALAQEAARKLARRLVSTDRWGDALPLLDRLVDDPRLSAAERFAWVRAKLETGNLSEADRIGRVLRNLVRDTPAAYGLLGQYEVAVGNPAAARLAFHAALQHDPKSVDVAVGLARIMRESGESEQALRMLSALEPKTAEVHRLLSQIHAERGEWQMAATWFEKSAISEEEKRQTAWYLFRAGQYDEATLRAEKGGLFEAILEAESGRFEKLARRNARLLKKIIGEAETGGAGAQALSKRWVTAMIGTARKRMEAGDDEAAIEMFDRILKRVESAEALYVKGVAQMRLGLYEDARRSLTAAAQSQSFTVPAHLRLGQLDLIRGRPEEALAFLDKAGPGADPSELILAWGTALAMSKSPEQGEQILQHLAKKNVRGKFFLGRLLEQQDRQKEALEYYKSAVKEDESFLPARYRMGEVALKTGDLGMAEMSFNLILERPDAGPYADVARARLRDVQHAARSKF